MTEPLDLDALERRSPECRCYGDGDQCWVCDAHDAFAELRATRAERDAARQAAPAYTRWCAMRDRAEHAEADALNAWRCHDAVAQRVREAEAAIARVRAECDRLDSYAGKHLWGTVSTDAIRGALDGTE